MKDNHKKTNPIVAGIAGAVVGVAAGATAAFLSDKKNRKMIGKKVDQLVDEGKDKINDIRDDVQDKIDEAKSGLRDKKNEVKKDLKSK